MDRTERNVKAERLGERYTNALTRPANCNKAPPLSLRLEDSGLTPPLLGGLFELISCCSTYGATHRDRSDLRAAAALVGDVLNRARRAEEAARPALVHHG